MEFEWWTCQDRHTQRCCPFLPGYLPRGSPPHLWIQPPTCLWLTLAPVQMPLGPTCTVVAARVACCCLCVTSVTRLSVDAFNFLGRVSRLGDLSHPLPIHGLMHMTASFWAVSTATLSLFRWEINKKGKEGGGGVVGRSECTWPSGGSRRVAVGERTVVGTRAIKRVCKRWFVDLCPFSASFRGERGGQEQEEVAGLLSPNARW